VKIISGGWLPNVSLKDLQRLSGPEHHGILCDACTQTSASTHLARLKHPFTCHLQRVNSSDLHIILRMSLLDLGQR
jgi:hypothetical protein